MKDTIYIFYYNYCIHESAATAMSLHKTKAGAYNAMKKHLYYEYDLWLKQDKWNRLHFKFGCFESWFIREEVLND